MEQAPVQLYFEEYGEGFPLIFLHGFPLDHTIWDTLIPLLRNEVRLILPDLRGHGRSPVPDGVYTMRVLAEDVLALMERLQITQAILVGHSMGGYAALNFAHNHPHRIAGLALVASQAAADSTERRQTRLQTAEDVQRKGAKIVAQSMAPRLSAREELTEPIAKIILQTAPKGIMGALKGLAERPNAEEWLSGIECPAVVIAGAQDALVPLERARTMAQLLGHAWLVELPGVGHMPMMEAPEALAQELRELVRRVKTG